MTHVVDIACKLKSKLSGFRNKYKCIIFLYRKNFGYMKINNSVYVHFAMGLASEIWISIKPNSLKIFSKIQYVLVGKLLHAPMC